MDHSRHDGARGHIAAPRVLCLILISDYCLGAVSRLLFLCHVANSLIHSNLHSFHLYTYEQLLVKGLALIFSPCLYGFLLQFPTTVQKHVDRLDWLC